MFAVIFDMDGVIFDSERATYEGWQEIADKYGFTDLWTPYRQCIGVNYERTKEIFLDFYGDDFPFVEYCREQSENYHRKYDGGNLPVKKGVRELLSFLKEQGCYTAVASSTRTQTVTAQIRDAGLLPYFQTIIGGDRIKCSKPAPDIFLKAAEGIKEADKTAIYVIEDSYNGIRAAHAAKMHPIMVPDMLPATDEMEELADVVLPDLTEVIGYLQNRECK
ncbi:MAG: HAD family phosphatase [Lachnospiraceae bacterium]|nr:HAD family phosphatase [Lachnospiraceae bacterium]